MGEPCVGVNAKDSAAGVSGDPRGEDTRGDAPDAPTEDASAGEARAMGDRKPPPLTGPSSSAIAVPLLTDVLGECCMPLRSASLREEEPVCRAMWWWWWWRRW